MGIWDMWRALALSLLWAVSIVSAAPAAAETIERALIAAYQNDPALNPQSAVARGRTPQTWTDARPRRDGAAVPRPPDIGGALASSGAHDDYQAAKAAATEQTVLLNAATAYMDLLRDGALLEVQRRNVEVLRAESQVGGGRADVLAAEAQYAKSRAAYRLTIGREADGLSPAAPVDRLSPRQLGLAIEIARARHPDVGVAAFAARKQMDIDTARDLVEANVVSAWGQLDAAKAGILATQAPVAAAEIALNGIREQARVGQRMMLDVLNAQQELVKARVALVTAQHDRVVSSYTLLAAVGELNLAKLGLLKPDRPMPRPLDRATD
jgi:outer membrane protein TolC